MNMFLKSIKLYILIISGYCMYYSISLYFSVQKNPETKEIHVVSTVFRVSAYVSINSFLVQDFTGSIIHIMKLMH